MTSYEDINCDLEKLVFLWNAKEGNPGIYDLIWELSFYDLAIEDKYRIAHKVLREILSEGLVSLEKYQDLTLSKKIEPIKEDKIDDIINNPNSWYPCNEIYSITLTTKGEKYLNEQNSIKQDIINIRFKGKNNA